MLLRLMFVLLPGVSSPGLHRDSILSVSTYFIFQFFDRTRDLLRIIVSQGSARYPCLFFVSSFCFISHFHGSQSLVVLPSIIEKPTLSPHYIFHFLFLFTFL